MNRMIVPSFAGVSFLRDTKSVRDLSEMAVAFALVHAGYVVAKPYGENCRYDFVIDKDGVLSRVQVKTGPLRNGVIEWHCCSTHSQGARLFTKPYTDQIDFFGVYCPQLRTTYQFRLRRLPDADARFASIPPRIGKHGGFGGRRTILLVQNLTRIW
jgi:hypothetical protein